MGATDAAMDGLPHEEEDFGKTLLDMLGSPRHFSSNGLNTLFSPEINGSANYDLLMSHGSLGSPDFTRQLNMAGLHDFSLSNHGRQASLLPPLQLPSQPVWPGGWSADSWLPQSPTCPTLSLSPLPISLSPLPNVGNGSSFGNGSSLNGGSFHVGQLLASQDNELLQPTTGTAGEAAAPAGPAATQSYAPVTPNQQQFLPQLAPAQQQGLPTMQHQQATLELQLQEQHMPPAQYQQQHMPPAQYQQQHYVQLPPGLWLVAPTAHQAAPAVVQQSPALAAAANNAAMHHHQQQQQQQQPHRQQQQQGRKRQLEQQHADVGRRKAARAGSSTSPSAASAAAAAGGDSQPTLGGSNLASPATPTVPAAAAAAGGDVRVTGSSGGKAPTSSKAGAAQLGTGALVWGKVNRYPWWPAVVVPPSAEDEPAPAPTAFAAASAAAKPPPVFVRFLGTHDTAWLEAGKVSAWPVQLSERSSRTKAAAFVNALREGRTYAATGALPGVFRDVLPGAVQQQDDTQHSDTASGSDGEQQQSGPQQAPAATIDSSRSRSRSHAATPTASGSQGLAGMQQDAHHSSSSVRPSHADVAAAVVAGGDEGGVDSEAGRGSLDKGHVPAKRRREPKTAGRVSTRSVPTDVRHTRSGRQLRGS